MEYLGAFRNRRVDQKRRFVMPSEWIDDDEFMMELFNTKPIEELQNSWIYLYSKKNWLEKWKKLTSSAEKLDLSRRSVSVKLESNNRLTLPKGINWKSVDIVGMSDCIVLISSSC